MHGPNGVIFDSINRWNSNRLLLQKDRGAFNIKERNSQFKIKGIQGIYKKATPIYMAQLNAQLKQDKSDRRRMLIFKISILCTIILGLSYLVWGFNF